MHECCKKWLRHRQQVAHRSKKHSFWLSRYFMREMPFYFTELASSTEWSEQGKSTFHSLSLGHDDNHDTGGEATPQVLGESSAPLYQCQSDRRVLLLYCVSQPYIHLQRPLPFRQTQNKNGDGAMDQKKKKRKKEKEHVRVSVKGAEGGRERIKAWWCLTLQSRFQK